MVWYNKTMYEGKETLLEQTYTLAVENNKLLKKMRTGARIGFVFKLMFWAAMLGVPVWMYFTILQPVIQQSLGALEQVQNVTGVVGSQSGQIEKLINALPNLDILNKLGN